MSPDTCYYDGECGLCQASVRRLRRLDWLGRLRFVNMLAVPEADLPVPLPTAMQGMPMRTADGRVLVGFPAVRRAMSRTPLAAPVAWLLYLPGINILGQRLYRVIARNRRRTPACSITSGPAAAAPQGAPPHPAGLLP